MNNGNVIGIASQTKLQPFSNLSVTNNISSGDSDEMISHTTVLTNAEIKHLPTLGISVLTGVSNKLLTPVVAEIQIHWVADYTNITDSASLQIKNTGSNDLVFLPIVNSTVPVVLQLTNLLAWGGSNNVSLPSYFAARSNGDTDETIRPTGYVTDVSAVGAGWEISILGNDGDLADGDDGNTMTVTVYYAITDAA